MTEVRGGPPAPGRGPSTSATAWQTATVLDIRDETSRTKTFRVRLARPTPHLAGQHYVIRLTAPDGYTASRSYSVASPPDGSSEIDFTVERLDDGEVSGFLHDEVRPGDGLDMRGPIGGWFVWEGATPALLVGGGSGVVPLMAMLRLARRTERMDLVHLVVSVRSPNGLYYADEIAGPETTVVYTRQAPPGWPRPPGRLTADDLPRLGDDATTAYVCGSAGFAAVVSDLLVDNGLPETSIRVERFGPSGA